MTLVAGLVMVTAGAMCFGGAIVARRWFGIVAAALMVLAMLDVAFVGLLPPLVWAGGLLIGGLVLGFDLRFGPASRGCGVPDAPGVPRNPGLERSVLVSAALAYPATAWLLLSHGGTLGGAGGSTGAVAASDGAEAASVAGAHRGHGAQELLTGVLPTIGAAALAAVLVILAIVALRQRRRFLTIEAGGMAAMLGAMLLMH